MEDKKEKLPNTRIQWSACIYAVHHLNPYKIGAFKNWYLASFNKNRRKTWKNRLKYTRFWEELEYWLVICRHIYILIRRGEIIDIWKVNIKDYKDVINLYKQLFDAESVVVDWNYEGENLNMHLIGILYIVTLADNKLKSDGDGLDSLDVNWYSIDELKEEDVLPLVWKELNKLKKGWRNLVFFCIISNRW